jgi:hypothetical protein
MVSLLDKPLPRVSISPSIRQFSFVDSPSVTDAFNELVNDINGSFATSNPIIDYGIKTVATLPASPAEFSRAVASDGRKIGEGPGAGSGVNVYYSLGQWRVYSTDAPVQS